MICLAATLIKRLQVLSLLSDAVAENVPGGPKKLCARPRSVSLSQRSSQMILCILFGYPQPLKLLQSDT